jgi:cobalt-zinc-cadmium efflux system protein
MVDPPHGESETSGRILRGLWVALVLAVVVLALESIGVVLSRSLSLTVDAVHSLPDIFAFAISYLSLAHVARGPTEQHTFGSHRLEVFAALLNAFVILAAGALFAVPAVLELWHGGAVLGPVDPAWILFAAIPSLLLRVGSALYLERMPRSARDLNVRSVIVHLGTDVAITVTLLVDAVLLLLRPADGWVDAAAALAICLLLVYESIPIFRGGWDVLTERAPRGLSMDALIGALEATPRVRGVHDVHVWSVCPTLVCMTAHVGVDEMSMTESGEVKRALRRTAEDRFGIVHAVFELESERTPT